MDNLHGSEAANCRRHLLTKLRLPRGVWLVVLLLLSVLLWAALLVLVVIL